MNNKLSLLLKKIFLSSLAGIPASNANSYPVELNSNDDDNKVESLFKKKIDLSPKLLLKKGGNNEWNFMAHRSHRSHQSHRSHYSSSSSGGSAPTSSNPGIKSGTNSNSNGSSTTTVLKLGSRTLKRGMSGTDVTELVNILLRKQYLKLDGGGTQVTGIYTYDQIIEDAIKKFQANNGLTSDGICSSATIYYLKNK